MCETGYSIEQLAADLRKLREKCVDDDAMAAEAPEPVRRFATMSHAWLRPWMCEPHPTDPSSAGLYRLHEEPDHSLAVFVVTWLPGDETPPHDHATWAVVAGLEGSETNHWWRRLDDGRTPGHAEVRRAGSRRIEPGTLVAMGPDGIHSVHNDSNAKSVTLHVYGMNVDYTDRHRFDPARHTIAPYRFGGTSRAATSREEAST